MDKDCTLFCSAAISIKDAKSRSDETSGRAMPDLEYLHRAKSALRTDTPEHASAYAHHIDSAIASRSGHPLAVPRTLDDVARVLGRAPYVASSPALRALMASNCHIGQRKLALALLDFLNACAKTHQTTDLFVVYPGASILACLAAAGLYPSARFLCFDPAFDATVTNVRQELGRRADEAMRNVHVVRAKAADAQTAQDAFAKGFTTVVFTDAAGMYGSDSHALARDVHAHLDEHDTLKRKRAMVFCSDVRMSVSRTLPGGGTTSDPSEQQIAEEMVAQARWIRDLGVQCFQVKFRMPFAPVSDDISAMYESLGAQLGSADMAAGAPTKTKAASKEHPDTTLPYLDGECRIQIYARETSAELRLLGTSGVRVKRYSVQQIEECMAAFNVVYRAHAGFACEERQDIADVVRSELSPESMLPNLSFDAVREGEIVYAAIVAQGGPRDAVTVRKKLRAFSSLFAFGRHPKTCASLKHAQTGHVERKRTADKWSRGHLRGRRKRARKPRRREHPEKPMQPVQPKASKRSPLANARPHPQSLAARVQQGGGGLDTKPDGQETARPLTLFAVAVCMTVSLAHGMHA